MNEDRFWINDFRVLYRDGNLTKIFPQAGMSQEQLLNSLTRLFIILLILTLIFKPSSKYIKVFILAILATIVIYYANNRTESFCIFDAKKNRKLETEKNEQLPSTSFEQWLYQSEETCKENSEKCYPSDDIRYHREIISLENEIIKS